MEPKLYSYGLPTTLKGWLSFSLSMVPGLFILLYIRFISLTSKEVFNKTSLQFPNNVFLVTYHPETFSSMACSRFWNFVKGPKDFVYLSFHGFLSYMFAFWPISAGWKTFRYKRRSPDKPFQQIVNFLRNDYSQGIFGLRTDSGKPYGVVRASAVSIAICTGRPLVGIRQRATFQITIGSHELPLPFGRLITKATRVFPAKELEALKPEEALKSIQNAMDTAL